MSFIARGNKTGPFSTLQSCLFLKSVFVPILTYGHGSWAMTERISSQVQPAEMGFLRRVHGVTLRGDVRSCEICKALNVEPFLRIDRSHLRWFGHASRMPRKNAPTGKRPRGCLMARWSDYTSDLAWPGLGVEPAELSEIAVDREVFRVPWVCCPCDLHRGKVGTKINE